jgi:uncharacterized membrane protein YqaE (UPF0057 family)
LACIDLRVQKTREKGGLGDEDIRNSRKERGTTPGESTTLCTRVVLHPVTPANSTTIIATMRNIPYRIMIMMVNIFFPPLAVAMLTGMGMDTALNCFFFLLAVIPSHVHGFYVSWVYFARRRRVSHFLVYQGRGAVQRGSSTCKSELTWLVCSHA